MDPLTRFYRRLNWKLPNRELRKKTGRSLSTLAVWRKRLGHPPSVNRRILRHRALLAKASTWDWSKSKAQLAREAKISREWVYGLHHRLVRQRRARQAQLARQARRRLA